MSYILIIDTSTKFLSISLSKDKNILASYTSFDTFSHAKQLTIEIEKHLMTVGIKLKDLNAIALNRGPGSFTGLRVGSSVGKGICYALDIPLISINGLDEYAKYFYSYFAEKYTDIFILLDARRDNYFYSHLKNGEIHQSTKFAHITEIETEFYLSRSPWIFNSSKDNFEQLKSEYLISKTYDKWSNKEFVDISNFEPNYMINNYQSKAK